MLNYQLSFRNNKKMEVSEKFNKNKKLTVV